MLVAITLVVAALEPPATGAELGQRRAAGFATKFKSVVMPLSSIVCLCVRTDTPTSSTDHWAQPRSSVRSQ
jgi:hypothetical protein